MAGNGLFSAMSSSRSLKPQRRGGTKRLASLTPTKLSFLPLLPAGKPHGACAIRASWGVRNENAQVAVASFGGASRLALVVSCLCDAGKVVIGDIDDMSGLYADINGPGAVEAIKMAIADFGGSALGQPIELLTADHQNKPDLGVKSSANGSPRRPDHGARRRKYRRQPRYSGGRQGKEGPILRHRRCGSLTHRQGLHALHRTLRL